MSMTNLPPGVSVNDIPGNRPEDIFEEHRIEALESFSELHGREFLLPDAATFDDIFTELGTKDEIEDRTLGSICGPTYRDRNTLAERKDCCSISNGIWAFRTRVNGFLRCKGIREDVLAKIRENMLPVNNDRLHFEFVEWEKDGLALVLVKHDQIIGQRYLALVDARGLDRFRK